MQSRGCCLPTKKSTLEQALDLKCNSTQELERNQQTIANIQANYCTQVLSDLAPKAPEGIQPKWSPRKSLSSPTGLFSLPRHQSDADQWQEITKHSHLHS